MTVRSVLLLALAAAHFHTFAVEVPRATIDHSIEMCQKMKRSYDPTAPREPAELLSLCTCATEGYFAAFSKTEWRALKKQAAGKKKDKQLAALAIKERSDNAEIECRKTLKIEAPKE